METSTLLKLKRVRSGISVPTTNHNEEDLKEIEVA